MRYLSEAPFRRWGRVIRPAEDAGSYVMIEPETRDPQYPPPPVGSVRLWHRRPGVNNDDEANWSVWFPGDQLGDWLGPTGAFEVEWLAVDFEPDGGDRDESHMVRFLIELEHPYDSKRDIGVDPTDLVRFALGASDYWAGLALGWLTDGLSVSPLSDVLRGYAADATHPQSHRHRAAGLLKGR